MKLTPYIQDILKNSKKDIEWKKEAEERKTARQESRKSGIIATQLAYFMKINGVSQTDLGKLVGVKPQQISKILKGKQNLTLGTIEKIESALKIDLIRTVNLESEQKLIASALQEIKSSSIVLDLGKGSIGYVSAKPTYHLLAKTRFYGGALNNSPLPTFANGYNEEIKQKAIKPADERFEIFKQEFHFESEEFLVDVNHKSPPKKVAWVEPESYIAEEI
jgi:transcriptional regulator with XRE-family HTH domain